MTSSAHDWDEILRQIDPVHALPRRLVRCREAEALMKTSAPNILARVFRAVAKGVTRK